MRSRGRACSEGGMDAGWPGCRRKQTASSVEPNYSNNNGDATVGGLPGDVVEASGSCGGSAPALVLTPVCDARGAAA